MRFPPSLSLVAVAAGVALGVACTDTTTSVAPTGPMRLSGADCFEPLEASIPVDSSATFLPVGPDCNVVGGNGKRKATLTWSNPQTPVRAGLNVDPTCANQVLYRSGTWKVTRCAEGTVTLTIYTDSVGTSVLQTIPIDLP